MRLRVGELETENALAKARLADLQEAVAAGGNAPAITHPPHSAVKLEQLVETHHMSDGESDIASVAGSTVSQQALGKQRSPTWAETLLQDTQLEDAAATRQDAMDQVATAISTITTIREELADQDTNLFKAA